MAGITYLMDFSPSRSDNKTLKRWFFFIMRCVVKSVAKHFPTTIISGRRRDMVSELVGLTELYSAGSHGMDIKFPVRDTAPAFFDHLNSDIFADQQDKEVNLFQPAKEFLPIIDENTAKLNANVEVKNMPSPLEENVQREWTCAVCLVTTNSKATLNSHLLGKKHRTRCELIIFPRDKC